MFTEEMRAGVETDPKNYLDHASPLVHDCAVARVEVHKAERLAKEKEAELAELQIVLEASEAKLAEKPLWVVTRRNKVITFVANGVRVHVDEKWLSLRAQCAEE